MVVINHIKEIRTRKGLTQKEVSSAISISKDTLSRCETGKQIPRTDIAIQLSNYLEVPMELLYEIVTPVLFANSIAGFVNDELVITIGISP